MEPTKAMTVIQNTDGDDRRFAQSPQAWFALEVADHRRNPDMGRERQCLALQTRCRHRRSAHQEGERDVTVSLDR